MWAPQERQVNRTNRLTFRASDTEQEAIRRLAQIVRQPSWGAAARQAAVALGEQLPALERAAQEYEKTMGTAASGKALLARVRALIAHAHTKDK